MNKGQMMIRVIAGGFLGYTGLSLIKDVLSKKPDHSIGFIAAGVIFILIGVWYLIRAVKEYMKDQREQESSTVDVDDDTLVDDAAIEEKEEQNVIEMNETQETEDTKQSETADHDEDQKEV